MNQLLDQYSINIDNYDNSNDKTKLIYELNDLYNSNDGIYNKITLNNLINETKVKLNQSEAYIIRLKQLERQLEKKLVDKIIDEYEITQLQDIKNKIIENNSLLSSYQSKLSFLQSKENVITNRIEDIWNTITDYKSNELKSNKQMKTKSKLSNRLLALASPKSSNKPMDDNKNEITNVVITNRPKKVKLKTKKKVVTRIKALKNQVHESIDLPISPDIISNDFTITTNLTKEFTYEDEIKLMMNEDNYNESLENSLIIHSTSVSFCYHMIQSCIISSSHTIISNQIKQLTKDQSSTLADTLVNTWINEQVIIETNRLNKIKQRTIDTLVQSCVTIVLYKSRVWLVDQLIDQISNERTAISNYSINYINSIISQAYNNAYNKLFDPWIALNDPPYTYLPIPLLNEVDRYYKRQVDRQRLRYKCKIFQLFKQSLAVKRFIVKRNRKICRYVISYIIHSNSISVDNCIIIQRFYHRYRIRQLTNLIYQIERLAYNKAISYYNNKLMNLRTTSFQMIKYNYLINKSFKYVKQSHKEFIYITTFYQWIEKYKKHRELRIRYETKRLKSALYLQSIVRLYLKKRRKYYTNRLNRFVFIIRKYISKNIVNKQRNYQRRLFDISTYLIAKSNYQTIKKFYSLYDKKYHLNLFIKLLNNKINYQLIRFYYIDWRMKLINIQKLEFNSIIKIQRSFRRYIVFRYILNYYKFRSSLVAIQSLIRRILAQKQYNVDIFYYRKAKCIQKIYRGYNTRLHLLDRRITDLNYACEYDNYNRLVYYTYKYRELLNELDSYGNTPLHNAAKNGSKRCIKLLLKCGLNPNAYNTNGYTPLHLIIMSSKAEKRDECCIYMLEHGFNDEIFTPDGKSCLLLAAEFGRTVILRYLLSYHENIELVNISDHTGLTPLQAACIHGYKPIIYDLIANGADVNMPGCGGTYPIHDCIQCNDIDIPNYLINHGAYVNVVEPYNNQSPLMLACRHGLVDYAQLFLLHGARFEDVDKQGQSAVHYAALCNSIHMYNLLREIDIDFDVIDYNGNCALHIAIENGSSDFAISLLEGGAHPSYRNDQGDQPAHIAAKYDYIDVLSVLCNYDDHLGHPNYQHLTPLGVARMYSSMKCIEYLENNFRKVDLPLLTDETSTSLVVRNNEGDVWWDRNIDETIGDIRVVVGPRNNRIYVNLITGEESTIPPFVSVDAVVAASAYNEIPIRRAVRLVKDTGDQLNRHSYLIEYNENKSEIDLLTQYNHSAIIIQKYVRRKLIYKYIKYIYVFINARKTILRFLRRHLPGFMSYKHNYYSRYILKIQSLYRGYYIRKVFSLTNEYEELVVNKNKRRLYNLLVRYWKKYQYYLKVKVLEIASSKEVLLANQEISTQLLTNDLIDNPLDKLSNNIKNQLYSSVQLPKQKSYNQSNDLYPVLAKHLKNSGWLTIEKASGRPIRKVGIYEIYLYPNTTNIFYYKNTILNEFSFNKPIGIQLIDIQSSYYMKQKEKYGSTIKEIQLAVIIQKLWRGYKVRSYYYYIEKAINLSAHSYTNYINNPDNINNLLNYTLYNHVVLHDYNRARGLYIELLRRMEWYGPDRPVILYSYIIFIFVTQDQDYSDILMLLSRAKKSEEVIENQIRKKKNILDSLAIQNHTYRYGRVYDFATIGFFKHTTTVDNSLESWHNYAAVQFLIYNNFNEAFYSFLKAFQFNQSNKILQYNFDLFMNHYYNNDNITIRQVVREKMYLIAQDELKDKNELVIRKKLGRLKRQSANKIKKWYRYYKILKNK